jgi:hypothetical protein
MQVNGNEVYMVCWGKSDQAGSYTLSEVATTTTAARTVMVPGAGLKGDVVHANMLSSNWRHQAGTGWPNTVFSIDFLSFSAAELTQFFPGVDGVAAYATIQASAVPAYNHGPNQRFFGAKQDTDNGPIANPSFVLAVNPLDTFTITENAGDFELEATYIV